MIVWPCGSANVEDDGITLTDESFGQRLNTTVESYADNRKVAGKAATWREAFKALSVGLDEVRHDQLSSLLGSRMGG